jgi:hypothetical protein
VLALTTTASIRGFGSSLFPVRLRLEDLLKYTLTLHEEGWTLDGRIFGSGPVFMYGVGGMPAGEEAKIANFGAPHRNEWRIRRIKGNEQSDWAGKYESAEVALAELQKQCE